MSDGNNPAPQVVRPTAPIPPLDWEQFTSSKVWCLTPLPVFCGSLFVWPQYAPGQDYAAQGIFSAHLSEAYSCVTALQAPAPRSASRYTALDLRRIPKVPTRASAAAAPPVTGMRLGLIKERKCDKKVVYSKVTYLKGSAPLPTSAGDPAPDPVIPSPVMPFTSSSGSDYDEVRMTV
jgi:hypothetical protein